MKKYIAILMTIVLTFSLSIPVFAHTWPENPGDWTKEDWQIWNEYWYNSWNNWNNQNYNYYNNCDWQHREWEKNRYNNCNNNTYNYNNYNFYSGVLNVYDGSTEDQATVLARIINIFAHGVSSQTAQAAVGWAVMNSVDGSGSKATVCTVADNFRYDYNSNTTDDFGRNLLPLARDIIFRWKAGRAGCANNGRVLPGNYYYVTSTGTAVTFGADPNEMTPVQNFGYASPYGN